MKTDANQGELCGLSSTQRDAESCGLSSTQRDAESCGLSSTRRDFVVLTATAMAGVGMVATSWPFVASLNPSADVLALATTEVNLSGIRSGQTITVMWRGNPVFVRHRTDNEIRQVRDVQWQGFIDPQSDEARVQSGYDRWLVTMGACTHLGCVPIARSDGWLCPCHGSLYDLSGRVMRGPAPSNLPIPPYKFLTDEVIAIG